MSWTCYSITLAADSDLCIGFHKLGFVQRTRYYIPPRNLWAAATALRARRGPAREKPPGRDDYKRADVSGLLRFTPLFPILDASGQPRFPWADAEFERDFVDSRGRATIRPDSATALDGGLFDMEYLTARSAGRTVRFSGFCWACGEFDSEAALKLLLARMEIGGERRYGMGRTRLQAIEPLGVEAPVFGCKNLAAEAAPVLRVPEGHRVPAHLLVQGCPQEIEISGELEPLTGRNTVGTNKAGQDHQEMQLCWAPGACMSQEVTLEVGAQGVWAFPSQSAPPRV